MTKVRIKPRILDVVEDDGMWLDQSTMTYYSKEDVEEVDLPSNLDEAADSAAIKAFPEKKAYSTVVDRVVDYNAIDRKNYRDGFIAGSEWGAEHSGDKKRLAMVRKERIEDHINELNDKYLGGVYSSYDVAKAYAEGNIDGQKWQKEQMLRGAVDGTVHHYAPLVHYVSTDEVQLAERLKQFQDGDRVKVIVIKED